MYQTKEVPDDTCSDYGILNPSSSNNFNRSDSDLDSLNLISMYEINHNTISVLYNSVKTKKLPIYSATLDRKKEPEAIVDGNWTTLYFRENLGKEEDYKD